MQRGSIWWASLPDAVGSMPGYRRPVLIVQDDAFNQSRINTVIAIVLTSNVRLATAPGNVFLPAKATGLPKNSVANVSQLMTIDKSRLTEHISRLSNQQMQQVEEGLRLIMAL